MIVPTVPLVEQQTFHFVKYLYGMCWIDGISGIDSTSHRAGNVLASDLCVMTPQILMYVFKNYFNS